MAIFRCISCDQIFDLSIQHSSEGLNFCGKCFSDHKDKLKPKITSIKYHDDPFEKEELPKQRKKKK